MNRTYALSIAIVLALLWDGARTIASVTAMALVLMAMGEASWTCAIVSLMVAYRPQWLATWSDEAYLGRPVRAKSAARPRR